MLAVGSISRSITFPMMSGSTPGGPDDDEIPSYDRHSASTYQFEHHSQSSANSATDNSLQCDVADESSSSSSSQSINHSIPVQQIQCFACLRMNDPVLMQPHKFIHPSYFIDAETHQTSLCIACYQSMGMDQSVNQSNSHLVRRCVWTVDGTDNHYAQCSGCGGPNRKNNTCETCPAIFCDACIRSFGGPKLWWKVENVEFWQCLAHERRPEWTNDCDLFTVPYVRCRVERGEFTPKTAINPVPYQSSTQSNYHSSQLQSLLMIAGLTYHTPLQKKKLASHITDVTELVNHLVDETKKNLVSEDAASINNLKSISSDPQPSPAVTISKPLKLISVSLYHKTGIIPDYHRRYIVGLMENLQTFTTVWPGWTVRIYYDSSMLVPAASPLDDQEDIDPKDRVIENEQGILTFASSPNQFIWDHSKYTSHLVSAWQTFMSWARDQPHIQLCYFNWPHLQDAEGFHLRHVGMLARFLALAEIGVTASHVIIADLDNLWTAKARDKAENFEPQAARFHRFNDWSYPWDLMGGGFSVRWPDDEMNPNEPETAPFHDIECAMHEFAQAHFSNPHEFYNTYHPSIEASSRAIRKPKKSKHKGKKGGKQAKKAKKKSNGHDANDSDYGSDSEFHGRLEDELFGYCVDQAFLSRYVWVRMKQFDSAAVAPGWIATTSSRIKNVPQSPNLPEQTRLVQNQNEFVRYFDMLTQSSRWPACYHLDNFPQYKSDDSLSWSSPCLGEWMKKKCKDITFKQTKTIWKETPFEAKDASAPLHYYSYVVDSRVRMVNSLINYLGKITTDSSHQHYSHHPFIGLPSLSSSLVHDHHSKRSRRPDAAGNLPKNRKHDWIVKLIHSFMERKRRAVQKAMLMHQSIQQKIMGDSEIEIKQPVTVPSSTQPIFDALSSFNQSIQQSNNMNNKGFDHSQTDTGFMYGADDDSDEYERQSTNSHIRRRVYRSGSPHAKRFKQMRPSRVQIIDLVESDCDDPPITSSSPMPDEHSDSHDGYSFRNHTWANQTNGVRMTPFDHAELIIDLTNSEIVFEMLNG